MKYNFLNIFLDPRELLAQAKNDVNPFLLLNNSSKVESIYNFFKSNSGVLYVSGFMGTGKAKIVGYTLGFLATETIKLKFNCTNSTILDDILLSFFIEFKNLSQQKIISEPKIKTENFAQKINSYFSQIEKPFVIVLDSFEALLDENRQEILDFISHLNSFDKVKTIIIGRTFDAKHFEFLSPQRIIINALEQEVLEKYLKSEKIKTSPQLIEQFYKQCRGYFFFAELAVKLMKKTTSSLFDFLMEFEKSYIPFFDFIARQAINQVQHTERNLFWFLSMLRHPISVDLLKKLNMYEEEKINYLVENLLIIKDENNLYVQDFLKDAAEQTLAPSIAQKVRQYIVDLYSTQLPLKPLERDICISRQTMRKEIEFHTRFLPHKPKNIDKKPVDIAYLSYAKEKDFEAKQPPKESTNTQKEKNNSGIDLTQRKNISLNLENLPYQKKSEQPSQIENTPKTVEEILQVIKDYEQKYDYNNVIELGKKALLLKTDKDFEQAQLSMHLKIANAYKKIADGENALKFYNLAQELCEKDPKCNKINYIKFNIANIYYETYKTEQAKLILLEIADKGETPLKVKAYLKLANISESLSNQDEAFEYYKKASNIANESVEEEILSEIYFKYALALDDKNDVQGALENYKKCIDVSDNPKINKFLSSSYSNIANLNLEKNENDKAIINFQKAQQADKKVNNTEGVYYTSSMIADILKRKKPDEALLYFEDALDCAKNLKDPFYIVSASLALGDFNYDRKQNEIALKHYLYALEMAKENLSKENISKITQRINDIKFRLGVGKFDDLVNIIKAQDND